MRFRCGRWPVVASSRLTSCAPFMEDFHQVSDSTASTTANGVPEGALAGPDDGGAPLANGSAPHAD